MLYFTLKGEMNTLGELLASQAQRLGKKTAIIFQEGKTSYQQLNQAVNKISHALLGRKVGRGDRVGILLGNCPQFVISYFAIAKTGGIVVPLNTMFKGEEIFFILRDSGISLLITSPPFLKIVEPYLPRLEELNDIILVGGERPGAISFSDILEEESPAEVASRPEGDDPVAILYTSGTTGHPKGAMLTHKNLLSNVSSCVKAIKVTSRDNFICLLPLFHSFSFTVCVLIPIFLGGKITLIKSLRPFPQVLRSIIRHRVTVFVGIPPIYRAMLLFPLPRLYPLLRFINPLRLCISGASSLPVETLRNFEKRFHIPLLEGYGLTEASPVVSINPLEDRRGGSIGIPLPEVEIKILDEKGEELPPGKVGELVVKGPNVMKGYYNRPQETKEAIKDGWLYTGDLAKKDEDGFLYIVDRKKDMIVVRGLNVYPREVEEVLYSHPKVAEAAVIGRGDVRKGEIPVAIISLKKGEKVTEKEIIQFLKEKLANYKVPHRIYFRESLPKTATGKILKKELKNLVIE